MHWWHQVLARGDKRLIGHQLVIQMSYKCQKNCFLYESMRFHNFLCSAIEMSCVTHNVYFFSMWHCDISFSISLVQPECRSHKCWTTEGWPDADQATKILTGSKLNPDDPDDEMSYDAMMRMLWGSNFALKLTMIIQGTQEAVVSFIVLMVNCTIQQICCINILCLWLLTSTLWPNCDHVLIIISSSSFTFSL